MKREDIIQTLHELAEQCESSGDKPIASILYILCGAIGKQKEVEIAFLLYVWTEQEVAKEKAKQ